MPHIQRRKGKTGVSWRVRYIDPDGAEKSKSFRRKADADDFALEVAHTIRTGSYVDPSAGQQTVRAYLEEWRGMQAHHRPRTARSTKTRFDTMVYPLIGHHRIGRVRPSTVAKWQAALVASGDYSASTIGVVRSQLAGAFNDAVRDRRLASNPFTGVKAPEVERRRVVPRTIAQVEAGRRAVVADRNRAVIRVAAGSGLRWAELFGLTVDRVDFLRREIRVDRQLVGRKGPEPVFGPPKTKASDRTVPIPDVVVAELAAHLARFPARAGRGWWAEGKDPVDHAGLIFTTSLGTPMTRSCWAPIWAPVQAAMRLAEREGLHQLRHFYASVLIADGRSVIEVQERLGHASAQETWDTYSHLFPDAAEGTRRAIDVAFRALDEPAAPGEEEAGR